MESIEDRLAGLSSKKRRLLAERLRSYGQSVSDDASGERLAAYVVFAPGMSASVVELRRFLQTRLPAYMIPAAFIETDHLPVHPNGKLNRDALPDPNVTGPRSPESFVPSRTSTERTIEAIW